MRAEIRTFCKTLFGNFQIYSPKATNRPVFVLFWKIMVWIMLSRSDRILVALPQINVTSNL